MPERAYKQLLDAAWHRPELLTDEEFGRLDRTHRLQMLNNFDRAIALIDEMVERKRLRGEQ